MKITNMIKKSKLSILLGSVILALFFVSSCNLGVVDLDSSESAAARSAGFLAENGTYTLFAGQNINSGLLTVSNDADTLTVTFTAASDWFIAETHLEVVSSLTDVPSTRQGSPIPGQFSVNETHNPAVSEVIYTFSLADNGFEFGDTIVIAAHAVVQNIVDGEFIQEETAWSSGPRFVARGNWATYSAYVIQEPAEVVEDEAEWKDETAYAGDTAGNGNAWWFAFDASDPAVQNIYAGQKLVEGASVTLGDGTLTIDLGDNMRLQEVDEPVKIQGYDELPDSRPPSGPFTTYKGDELSISVAGYNFFVIHLDVDVKQ